MEKDGRRSENTKGFGHRLGDGCTTRYLWDGGVALGVNVVGSDWLEKAVHEGLALPLSCTPPREVVVTTRQLERTKL